MALTKSGRTRCGSEGGHDSKSESEKWSYADSDAERPQGDFLIRLLRMQETSSSSFSTSVSASIISPPTPISRLSSLSLSSTPAGLDELHLPVSSLHGYIIPIWFLFWTGTHLN